MKRTDPVQTRAGAGGVGTRLAALLVVAGLVLAGCTTAPVTGRQQFILVPESQDATLGLQAYRQILSRSRLRNDSDEARRVREIGDRIARVSGRPDFEWEFNVIEDDSPNAFALPGGKVGVHTGLFRVARNDAQLAAVMAHEVGHAIARHGPERISRQMVLQGVLAGAGALAGDRAKQYAGLAAQAATLGVILPFTRGQESEADEIGVSLMARAGYDPREAVTLWQNFARLGGPRQPEFMSTHPLPDTRIQRIQALLPRAIPIYEQARASHQAG